MRTATSNLIGPLYPSGTMEVKPRPQVCLPCDQGVLGLLSAEAVWCADGYNIADDVIVDCVGRDKRV